jgi:hypothetical protein
MAFQLAARLSLGLFFTNFFSNTNKTSKISRSWLFAFMMIPVLFAPMAYASTNIALDPSVSVTASSENAPNQLAIKAVDGIADGYPGDSTREWATVGEGAGAWIELAWPTSYLVDQVVLYDRLTSEHVQSGTLSFSDGTTVAVGSVNSDGSAFAVNFTAREVTSVRLTIDSVTGGANIGLTEFEVFGTGGAGGASEIIVDNLDSNTLSTGTWTTSSGPNPWSGGSVYNGDVTNRTFQWTPDVIQAGSYEVYAWWTYHSSRSSTVPYRIQSQDG